MSSDFYTSSILPHAAIIIKICRAYTNTQEDFEDYYQEVCLQIWKSRNNFREQSEWSTWVYRLTLNVCLTLLKKKKNNHQHFASDYLPVEVMGDSRTSNTYQISDEFLNQLYDAIRQLSEVDRGVILLYLEEKSYQQIADIIGTNSNNIGVRIKRIKERLKKILHGKVN
jgi:RNA polymerase sigma-70 factor (ECF subfamily)